MKILKRKDHYLFRSPSGSEYHMTHAQYKELGKREAIKFVESELKKKSNSKYSEKTIDFKRARALGFCSYGIEDFCTQLNLDKDKEYTIEHLSQVITLDVFLEYSNELLKLFGTSIFDKFGGVKKLLTDHPTERVRNVVLNSDVLSDKKKHILACMFAKRVLHNFEDKYPEDKRPRTALEVKVKWIEEKFGKVDKKRKEFILA